MDIQLKRLPHQIECLKAITSVFEDVRITSNNPIYQNPIIYLKDDRIIENIDRIWDGKDLDLKPIPKSMRRRVDGEILGIDAKFDIGLALLNKEEDPYLKIWQLNTSKPKIKEEYKKQLNLEYKKILKKGYLIT